MTIPRPPFDPELAAVLTTMALPPTLTSDMILENRMPTPPEEIAEMLSSAGLEKREVTIPGFGEGSITVSVVSKPQHTGNGPGIYYTHGGGMVVGDRWTGFSSVVDWVAQYDAVAITVEYRLAPEYPDPTPVEDCYAGLLWVAEHTAELGIDPQRILIAGGSAGGGLAAGVALLARDRKGPALCGQLLMYPMIDDRDSTLSTQQIDGVGVWDRSSNIMGWTALLGDRRNTDEVSIYAAPARATDLGGLPPAFIDCGSAEVFRDEDIAYAQGIWAAGGIAELHVWPGGFHAFESFAPQLPLSQQVVATRNSWVSRILNA